MVPAEREDQPVLSDLIGDFDCSQFDCGDDDEVTSFLRIEAANEHRMNLNRTQILHYPGDLRVLGFITMSMGQVGIKFGGLPDHPVGCVHVAYLGIQKEHHGKGWGSQLVDFAINKAVKLSSELGCRGVGLNCRDKRLSWYEEQGFQRYGGTTDMGGPLNRMFFDIRGEDSETASSPGESKPGSGPDSASGDLE